MAAAWRHTDAGGRQGAECKLVGFRSKIAKRSLSPSLPQADPGSAASSALLDEANIMVNLVRNKEHALNLSRLILSLPYPTTFSESQARGAHAGH